MAEKKIGANVYRVELPDVRAQFRLQIKLGQMMGPAYDGAAAAFSSYRPTTKVDEDGKEVPLPPEELEIAKEANRQADAHLIRGFADWIMRTEVDSAEQILVDLCEMAQIKEDGAYTPVIFDHHFQRDLFHVYEVVYFVLETLFLNFISGLSQAGFGRKMIGR